MCPLKSVTEPGPLQASVVQQPSDNKGGRLPQILDLFKGLAMAV